MMNRLGCQQRILRVPRKSFIRYRISAAFAMAASSRRIGLDRHPGIVNPVLQRPSRRVLDVIERRKSMFFLRRRMAAQAVETISGVGILERISKFHGILIAVPDLAPEPAIARRG